MTGTCPTCRHSRLTFEDENGEPMQECWRYPPILIVLEGEVLAVRPSVQESDTCGEHSA